jgi:hypothetical protein
MDFIRDPSCPTGTQDGFCRETGKNQLCAPSIGLGLPLLDYYIVATFLASTWRRKISVLIAAR